MFRKKEEKEINVGKLNTLISLGNNLLKLLIIFVVIAVAYLSFTLIKQLNVIPFLLTILTILTPLIIGLVISWILNPIVGFLNKKGLNRTIGTIISYIVLLLVMFLILNSIIPLLASQINDFVTETIPETFKIVENFANDIFDSIKSIEGVDIEEVQNNLFATVGEVVAGIVNSLPDIIVSFIGALFSGIGNLLAGLVIGFLLLINYDNNKDFFYSVIPRKYRKEVKEVITVVNKPVINFLKGVLIDGSVIFVLSGIAFSIIGLESALLFALFCALTNVIPYIGPYIGGAPAVLIGLTQSLTVGIAVFVVVFVLQFLEGNFLQPFIMSKTTKLNPVVIIVGLLVFGYFFGILGMIISTPVIAAGKELFNYLDKKFNILETEENN